MTDLHRALADIHAIRSQVARDTQFRGYGPASIAISGMLALAVAAVQAQWLKESAHDLAVYLGVWLSTAAVAVALTTAETIRRAKRVHSGLAWEMVQSAVEQFMPAAVVGFLLTIVLARQAPNECWMLPGLWQLIFSLGVFASCRFLPRPMFGVGLWYLTAGLVCLVIGSGERALSPWAMGVPFGVGQVLVAAVLWFGFEDVASEES